MSKKVLFLPIALFILFSFLNYSKAETGPLYLGNDNVYYTCQGKTVNPQNDDNSENDDMTFDLESVKILNDTFFSDKNGVYFVSTFNYYCYFFEVPDADSETFEIFTEDKDYAMDKNNIYYQGKVIGENETDISDNNLYSSLRGKIILQVEANGEAYYVSPNKQKMYFLSRPIIAFKIMREQGIGISNNDLEKIEVASNYCPSYKTNCDNVNAYDATFANNQKGKIFLQVEENGEAWYINPNDSKRYFLGRPTDAFNVMRNLGLGISDNDFEKILVKNNIYENKKFGISFNYPKVNEFEKLANGFQAGRNNFSGDAPEFKYTFRAIEKNNAHINMLLQNEVITFEKIMNSENLIKRSDPFLIENYNAVKHYNYGKCNMPEIIIFGDTYVYVFGVNCGRDEELDDIIKTIQFLD